MSLTYKTSWSAGNDRTPWKTSYGNDYETSRFLPSPSARGLRPHAPQLTSLPPAGPSTPRLETAQPRGSILPGASAFYREQQLRRPDQYSQFGRNGHVARQENVAMPRGGLYAPIVPEHALDSSSYHPKRMCGLTKFDELKSMTTHDFSSKMVIGRTGRPELCAQTIDSRGIDTYYGRRSTAATYVEQIYASPYPASHRFAGYGYATSR
jgi:hypothetical protein